MRTPLFFVFLLLLLAPLHAQTPADVGGATQVGPVNVSWHTSATYAGSTITLVGNVDVSNSTFGLTAQTVALELATAQEKAAAKSSGLRRATAIGTSKQPVTGHFEQITMARSYTMRADRAVFTPASATSKGETGMLELTGNVVLTIRDPAALDGPAVSKSEHMIVHLGPAPDYPKIESGPGSLQLTPLQ